MYMTISPTCMYVYHMNAWCPWRSKEGTGSPGTGVINGYEPPYWCWELKPSPLQEQHVLLIAEPSLQPSTHIFKCKFLK